MSVVVALIILYAFFFPQTTMAATSTQLLTKPWKITSQSGAKEAYQLIDAQSLKGNDTLRLTYDTHGTCLLLGDASAIIFDQPIGRTWRYVSLANFGKNCTNGEQTVDIPLSRFRGLNTTKSVGTFHVRFWQSKPYTIDIKSAVLYKNDKEPLPSGFAALIKNNPNFIAPLVPSPVPSATPRPPLIAAFPSPAIFLASPFRPASPTPVPSPTALAVPTPPSTTRAGWSIQSVSSMKETKDRICSPRSAEFIDNWMDKAVEIGANYVSVETPYDSPACGNTVFYTAQWINAARARGLKVWHRHMPLSFEGIYDIPKNNQTDYLRQIELYIKANRYFFAEGDIFTPIPEPQNGGISGGTYCPQKVCQFSSSRHFNAWLRDAIDRSNAAFTDIGMSNKIKVGYYGFDGFVAWGDNNPDWNGMLEDATVLKMGNITIDHYPEIVGDTMENDLGELERRYPNIPIIIGEWGTITGTNTEEQVLTSMKAAQRPSVVGFNYWHMGVGGNEELITETMAHKAQFDEVQRFFKYGGRL